MSSIVERLLADKAVSWFKSKGTPKSTNSDDKSGWITKAVMAVAVLAFVAYLAYSANRRAKALAKAKHERDVAVFDHGRAVRAWELADIDEALQGKLEKVERLNSLRTSLDENLAIVKKEHEYERFKIGAIESWDDMDRYLDGIGH
tara:strand:- start:26 stop:463 length:438 start_codon:yes stop_codon:yes gene_type:complete